MRERVIDFLDGRTGLVSALRRWLEAPPRLSALGTVLAFLFLLQMATGVALALHYAPSTTDAWGSVWYLQYVLPAGGFLRSLHHWGTSAIVLALALHLLLTALAGAYRKPHEISWWLSVGALLLVLGAAMTGNPLPWDQQGYWGARVESGIIADLPLVGGLLGRLFVGGSDLGNLTLTRFYALHAIVLPALLALLGAAQWTLAGRNRRVFARDPLPLAILGCCVVLGGLSLLALVAPAPLGPPAEPASHFQATPAWYFLPLNQLVAIAPPALDWVATAVLPAAAVIFLLALPFLDGGKRATGLLAPRLPALGGLGAGGIVTIGLIVLGLRQEATDESLRQAHENAAQDAARAIAIAAHGLPPDGAAAMLARDPLTRGKRLFAEHCAACHQVGGQGTDEPNGPDLAGYLSADWLHALIADPQDPRFFGTTDIDEMDPYAEEDPALLADTVAFLQGLRAHPGVEPDDLPQALQEKRAAWDELACESCHEITPEWEGAAPNLAGYGSDTWLRDFLREPDGALFYAESNEMPGFEEDELDDEEIDALIVWLRRLEELPVAPAPVALRAPDEAP